LTGLMGYRLVGQEGNRSRFAAADAQVGATVDLLLRPHAPRGRFGAGSIHYVAFRAADDAEQHEYLIRLRQEGFSVTPVQDRQYFHSIYFRIPGGVLFEIATDSPGFTFDEDIDALGLGLRLPPWLEPRRSEIERRLPALRRTGEVAQ
jgi:glyoxalase family protein